MALSAKDKAEIALLNKNRPQWAKDAEADYDLRVASGTMTTVGKRENKKFTQFAPGIDSGDDES